MPQKMTKERLSEIRVLCEDYPKSHRDLCDLLAELDRVKAVAVEALEQIKADTDDFVHDKALREDVYNLATDALKQIREEKADG